MSKLLLLVALISVGLRGGAAMAGDFDIAKDSDLWEDAFDPPYKTPTEVPRGSELRKTLFNQLRPKISAMVKGKKILFEGSMKAYKNWAFFSGGTVDSSGKAVALPPIENSDTVALWIRTRDGWTLVDFSGGHSDVFYSIWPGKYGVPKELLGFE